MKAAKIFAKNEAQTNKKTHTQSTARCSARGIKPKLKCCQLHEILQFDLRCMQRTRLRICLSCPFQCEATSEMLIELAKSTTSQLHWLLHFAPLTTLPSLLHVCFDLHDLRSLCKLERESTFQWDQTEAWHLIRLWYTYLVSNCVCLQLIYKNNCINPTAANFVIA